jgi:hypothetical protein
MLTCARMFRYEEEKAKGTLTEEENRRKEARKALERYTHYYQRYHSHDMARKKAQDVLTRKIADIFKKLIEVTKMAEGQLRFLAEVCQRFAITTCTNVQAALAFLSHCHQMCQRIGR